MNELTQEERLTLQKLDIIAKSVNKTNYVTYCINAYSNYTSHNNFRHQKHNTKYISIRVNGYDGAIRLAELFEKVIPIKVRKNFRDTVDTHINGEVIIYLYDFTLLDYNIDIPLSEIKVWLKLQ